MYVDASEIYRYVVRIHSFWKGQVDIYLIEWFVTEYWQPCQYLVTSLWNKVVNQFDFSKMNEFLWTLCGGIKKLFYCNWISKLFVKLDWNSKIFFMKP